MKRNLTLLSLLITIILTSCGEDVVPKPKGFLRLEYPEAVYKKSNLELPFTFEQNTVSDTTIYKPIRGSKSSFGLNIEYKKLKGTIYLTYKPITSKELLVNYLRDAQNFTQEHTKMADEIKPVEYLNPENNAYGMFYKIGGNAASQSQFYVTDSTKHFLTGSLYFYAKPNYDSILPAAHYLQKDIKRIMESVEWNEQKIPNKPNFEVKTIIN